MCELFDIQAHEDSGGVIRPTAGVKRGAGSNSTSSSVSQEPTAAGVAVTTVYDSTRDLAPVHYAGDATYTTEIDTAIEK